MALTTQAWGHDGKTYDGKDMRRLVHSTFYPAAGVVYGLDVTQQGSPDGTVQVAAGSAVVTATGSGLTGAYHVWNDAALTSPAIDPTTTNGRKDRLILRVTSGVPALEVVQGTASGSPAEPAITGDNYLELALITLPGSTTNVTNAMITDRRERAVAAGSFATTSSTSITPAGGAPVRYDSDTDTASMWDEDGQVWRPVGLGAWTSYSPTVTQSGTVTKTDTYSKYQRVGRKITWQAKLTITGSGTSNNEITVTLPVTAATSADTVIGNGDWFDASGGLLYRFEVRVKSGGTTVYLLRTDSTGTGSVGVDPNIGLANTDTLMLNVTYEAAS